MLIALKYPVEEQIDAFLRGFQLRGLYDIRASPFVHSVILVCGSIKHLESLGRAHT